MDKHIFGLYGKLLYRFRWLIVIIWLALLGICLTIAPRAIEVFQSTGFDVDRSESKLAQNYIHENFGFGDNQIIIIYSSDHLKATDPAFNDEIKKSLSGLKNFHLRNIVLYPSANKQQIAKNKHSAYAVVMIKQVKPLSDKDLKKLVSLVKKPDNMKMVMGGEPLFIQSVNEQTQTDLFKADLIAAPITIVMMIIIFESIVAALIPIIIGAGCSLMILSILYLVGSHSTLSIYTLNIALLLGLCLSLDYALFIISRFRFELRNGHAPEESVISTQATAGKAVFFSGLAVLVSLTPLLFFPINILYSIGVGGVSAVFVAVMSANLVLPSILSIMKHRVNYLSIKALRPVENGRSPFWRWLVKKVVRSPITFFLIIMAILLTLSYPIYHVKFGISDYHTLPPHSSSRHFFDTYNKNFSEPRLTPIQYIVTTKSDILSEDNLRKLSVITDKIKRNTLVKEVSSIVSTTPKLTIPQYHAMYTASWNDMNENVKKLLETSTREKSSIITVISKHTVDSPESRQLAKDLKSLSIPKGTQAQVAGVTLTNMDVVQAVKDYSPRAIIFILVCTYIILLVLLRSIFLPLKAIITTILSLCASYGLLVFIIQQGHFSTLLNFEPQGMLDISLLIIIFCALFGFSMDYEVFLLTRIREEYDRTGQTNKSITYGVEQSSRIITSAAIIVLAISASFMVADILMVKAFGLGIAVAIFTDAFLIRSLLVPATMTLMGKLNWYLPKWLEKIIPKF